MMQITRSQKEVDKVRDQIGKSIEAGASKYFGQTYEEGLEAMFLWLTGEIDDNPME